MPLAWEKIGNFYKLESPDHKMLAAFSTREFYPGFKSDIDYMAEERQRFLDSLGLSIDNLICPQQVHETQSFRAFESDRGKGAWGYDDTLLATDILLTSERKVVLSVLTADCLPLFVYDEFNQAIGISHVGWKGLAKGAVVETIIRMSNEFASNPSELLIALGCTIRSCCYEVSEPVTNYFRKFIQAREGKQFLDIPEVVKAQLKEQGVEEENIIDCNLCTACKNQEFFSFRKEGSEADRMMSVITLK